MAKSFFNKFFGIDKKEKVVNNELSNTYDLGGSKIYGKFYPIVTKSFDGEKTLGELGVVTNSIPDYNSIRIRAYDAELKTDLVKIITKRFSSWVVGSGLKLQSEPNASFLEFENIKDDLEIFKQQAEARFQIWSNSKLVDLSNNQNLHQIALDVWNTSSIGGDCLVICRVVNGMLTVQMIDGIHICDPIGTNYIKEIKDRGNFLKHGIECDLNGKHIAFYVKKGFGKFERIEAYGSNSNRKLAWMVYSSNKRVDHFRGVSDLASVLEKINKLDRYVEASVGKAEEAANIVLAIQHDINGTGENPLREMLSPKSASQKESVKIPDGYALGDKLANQIQESTSKKAYNLPVGAEMKSFNSEIETNFDQFFNSILNTICANNGLPPEIAIQKYSSNYSASRAAINNWGYIVDLCRDKITNDFYKPIYQLFIELEILKNKINAPSLLNAFKTNDLLIVEAFTTCRFIGRNMPHIDPLKEVKAIREMLGENTTPLISHEQATESLNAGDWTANYAKYLREDEKIIKPIDNTNNVNTNNNTNTN